MLFYSTGGTQSIMVKIIHLFLAYGQSPPIWEFRDEGKEIFQGVNSAPGIAVGDIKFGDVDYSGTMYVSDIYDDDWIGAVFSFQV